MTAAVLSPTGYRQVVATLARRNLLGIIRLPSTFVPSLVMPVFFVIAFSGAFAGTRPLLGIDPDLSILNWYMPMAAVQGAMFAGLTLAFGTARDIENGFFDRLLVAPAPRAVVMAGSVAAACVRAMFSLTTVLIVSVLGGLSLPAGPLGLVPLIIGGLGVATMAAFLGLGLTYRVKNQSAGGLSQVVLFMLIFISSAQVPIDSMSGWLKGAATLNPMSQVFDMVRAGMLDSAITWGEIWPGLLAIGGATTAFGLFAATGLAKILP